MSKIEEAVIKKIRERAEIGEAKYNTTMEREDLSLNQWLVHLQEELMDASVYLQKLIEKDEEKTKLENLKVIYDVIKANGIDADREDELNKRMDIIGRNGNDGEHYGTEKTVITKASGDIKITVDSYPFPTNDPLSLDRPIREPETRTPPCVAHSHWSYGFDIGDTYIVGDENFRIVGISDTMLSLEIIED